MCRRLFLKRYIELNGEEDTCDYCGCNEVCINLDVLMGPIINGIRMVYDNAIECLGYDGHEGGIFRV